MAERILDVAKLGAEERLLDLGCGTGNGALAAVRRLRPSGRVTGVDLAEGMVLFAANKAAGEGVRNVDYARMDCRRLGVADESFHVVTSVLGVPSVGHARCFAEARRVLRDAGRFVFCEWSGKGVPIGNAFRETLEKYRRRPLPDDVERLLEARRVIHASGQPAELRDPEGVVRRLASVGFAHAEFTTESITDVFPSVDAFLNNMASWGDNEREFRAMTPADREGFRREFEDRVASMITDEGLVVVHQVRYFSAVR